MEEIYGRKSTQSSGHIPGFPVHRCASTTNNDTCSKSQAKLDAETNEVIHDMIRNEFEPNKFELLVLRRKQSSSIERTNHPIVQSFIEHGPLTPMYNKYWNALSDTVVFPPPPTLLSCGNDAHDLLLPSTFDEAPNTTDNVATTPLCAEYSDSLNNEAFQPVYSNPDSFYDAIDNDQNMDENLSLVTTDLKTIASTIDTIFSLEEDSTLKSRMSDKLNSHWFELEKIFYKQIYLFIKLIEKNKFLTKENLLNPEEWKDRKHKCKNLAYVY